MYLIITDVKTAKKFLKEMLGDSDIALELVGEKESQHITVGEFGKITDGRIIVKIPRTLKALQDKIKLSAYIDNLKARAEVEKLIGTDIYGLG